MPSPRSVEARLERLERQSGVTSSGMALVVVAPTHAPLPRFRKAAAKLEAAVPGVSITVLRFFATHGIEPEKRPPEPGPRAHKREKLRFDAVRALDEDIAAWEASDEFRQTLTDEAAYAAKCAAGGSIPRGSLEQLVADCEQYGADVPAEARHVLAGRKDLVLLRQGILPVDGHHVANNFALDPASAATVEVQQGRPLLPSAPARPMLPSPDGCKICGQAHSLKPELECARCGCDALHHEAWGTSSVDYRDAWLCVWCQKRPQEHVEVPPIAGIDLGPFSREGACGTYQAYVLANADTCACRRCPGFSFVPKILPLPEATQ